jgi:hypothetical protein
VQLPQFLLGVPRIAYLIAAPVALFLITVVVVLATTGGNDSTPHIALNPTVGPSLANVDLAPTASPTPAATATAVPTVAPPNRADCAEIQGTAYESPEERQWYLDNCLNTTTATTSNTGGGGSTTAQTPPSTGGASGSEYALGARLISPSIGMDVTVNGMTVGADGVMPNPVGYFNAVQYSFPSNPGLGFTNKVLAGHVDCGRCYNGGSGIAVFWYVRDLAPGATAQYVAPDGTVTNYVVVSSYDVTDEANFAGIVADGAADMTLITCTGTFGGGHYNQRHVVALSAS